MHARLTFDAPIESYRALAQRQDTALIPGLATAKSNDYTSLAFSTSAKG